MKLLVPTLLICSLGLACTNSPSPTPTLLSIDPAEALVDTRMDLVLRGQDFGIRLTSNLESGDTKVEDSFRVRLIAADGGGFDLEAVTFIDESTLRAVLPANLPTGWYTAELSGPLGVAEQTPEAMKIYTDLDGDMVHDDEDTCVDVDGDGLGRAGFDTSGCENATADSDDDVVTLCADTDADGCEDCSTGHFRPEMDGTDFDNDGFCAAMDCDDSVPTCSVECSDTDGDGLALCAGDCDDSVATGANCTAGCAVFFADEDGDSFGDANTSSASLCTAPAGFVSDNTDCDDNPLACGNSCFPGNGAADLCDNDDQDCDSAVDEDHVASATSCGVGACVGNAGTLVCSAGVVSDSCAPLAGAAADDTTCNDVDDDCDGSSDEDYTPSASSCGVGACAGNTGSITCTGGVESDSCNPVAGASAENLATPGSCTDTIDNDCDDQTDIADFSCQGGANTPPVADFFVSPPAGDTSTNFVGDASASFDLEDAFGDLTIEWDWDGDETFEQSGSTSNHVFATPGAYTVVARVIDSGGLPNYYSFIVSVADPTDLVIVTTGVDESDAGATPASPGGTGFSLREAAAYASAQASRTTIQVPSTITTLITGVQLDLPSGAAGFDVVGDGSFVDCNNIHPCIAMTGPALVRILGLEMANGIQHGLSLDNGSHIVSRMHIHDVPESCIKFNEGASVIGPNNLLERCPDGVTVRGTVEIVDNIIRDTSAAGVRVSGNGDNSSIRGNEFIRSSSGVTLSKIDGVSILNNTFFDSGTGIKVATDAGTATILNNVLHTSSSAHIDAADADITTLDHNCYFGGTACTACTPGANSSTADPLFINSAVEDLRLQSSSPVIDQGIDTGFDNNGPAPGNFGGSAPDMGANETP